MQDKTHQGVVDLDFAIIFNETQFPEFVHEEIDPRPRCPNNLRQHLLRYFRQHLSRIARLAIARE